jgi:TetR/AcrR family acrAB operon transcriptional repressor
MRRTKEEAEQTRSQIIKAAIKVMNEKGIGSTRFEDIAKEANVTRGAIYHYFKSKNEIIFSIHSEMKKQMMELFERHISDQVDPVISIKNGLKETLTKFEQDEDYRAVEELFIKAQFASLLREDDDLNLIFAKEKEETICDMLELVKRGQETGSLRKDINANNMGFAFIAAYIGFITAWFLKADNLPAEGIVDDYVDIILHGIIK